MLCRPPGVSALAVGAAGRNVSSDEWFRRFLGWGSDGPDTLWAVGLQVHCVLLCSVVWQGAAWWPLSSHAAVAFCLQMLYSCIVRHALCELGVHVVADTGGCCQCIEQVIGKDMGPLLLLVPMSSHTLVYVPCMRHYTWWF